MSYPTARCDHQNRGEQMSFFSSRRAKIHRIKGGLWNDGEVGMVVVLITLQQLYNLRQ